MALRTTWTKANRLITQDLTTTYSRYLMDDVEEEYWLYSRLRVKEYEYFGMTHEAALACAKAMNKLYSRRVLKQEWQYSGAVPSPNNNWMFLTGLAAPNDKIYNPTNNYVQQATQVRCCGSARPIHEQGDAWKVVVSVNERLSYNYRPYQSVVSGNPLPWTAFEEDPDLPWYQFTGAIHALNENYDTGDVGYGSPST